MPLQRRQLLQHATRDLGFDRKDNDICCVDGDGIVRRCLDTQAGQGV